MNSLENYEVWSFFGFVLGYKPNNGSVESHDICACLKRNFMLLYKNVHTILYHMLTLTCFFWAL